MSNIPNIDITSAALSREVRGLLTNIIEGLSDTLGGWVWPETLDLPSEIRGLPSDHPCRVLAERRLDCLVESTGFLDEASWDLLRAAVSVSMLLLSGYPSLSLLQAILPLIAREYSNGEADVDIYHFAVETGSLDVLNEQQRWELLAKVIEKNHPGRFFDEERIAMGMPPRTAPLEGLEHTERSFWVAYTDESYETEVRSKIAAASGLPFAAVRKITAVQDTNSRPTDADPMSWIGTSSIGYFGLKRTPWEREWHSFYSEETEDGATTANEPAMVCGRATSSSKGPGDTDPGTGHGTDDRQGGEQ
jgi:hypothetical protein